MTGPPSEPPNWLRLKGGTGVGAGASATSKKFRASSTLFRKNSNAEPCMLFVPEWVTTFTEFGREAQRIALERQAMVYESTRPENRVRGADTRTSPADTSSNCGTAGCFTWSANPPRTLPISS